MVDICYRYHSDAFLQLLPYWIRGAALRCLHSYHGCRYRISADHLLTGLLRVAGSTHFIHKSGSLGVCSLNLGFPNPPMNV